MNSDSGLSALTSASLSESVSASNSMFKSGDKNPIAVGLALTSSSSLSDFTTQPPMRSPFQSASASFTDALPTVQVQVAAIELMSLGMPSSSLPQSSAKLSTDSSTPALLDIGIAPVVPPPLAATITGEIAFIDSSLPDYRRLVAGVRPGVTVIILEGNQDGVAQITQALEYAKNISAIHLVSPGDAGVLQLGMSELTTDSLDIYQASVQSWASALTPDADILLYGSNLGAGAVGDEFMKKISGLTAADVAASTNQTGSAHLGGDWNLEKTVLDVDTGEIAAKLAFQASLTSTYGAGFSASATS